MMKRTGAALAALTLLLTAGCGGGRPSEGELADVFKSGSDQLEGLGKVTDKAADCMAKAFHDSELSDEALQAIVDQDEDYEPSKDDEKAMKTVLPKMMKCAPDAADLAEQLPDPETMMQ